MLPITRVPEKRYLLRPPHGARTLAVSMEEPQTSVGQHESEPLWKRIDRLAREHKPKKVTTTDLAKAAGVTFAAAARWRKPPERGGSVPEYPNLAAIARALTMTIDELRGIYERHEPTGEGFSKFKATTTYKQLERDELIRTIATPFGVADPPLAAWLAAAEAQLASRP